ncbi:RasGEF domain containing protein [Tritrichomonas foetus]|uniref:RasGEF domain containing protein n=1 Tax=Tritrichomonas foetus TaxID=1144522 RepID=A0A1J4K9R0_9EUKA|nr:RasGEF domain containing protein [Tritrichomonas foetus]|eukprot:OHT06374.1 RasGEF domain containing protein [Tritrichomonas foetus]
MILKTIGVSDKMHLSATPTIDFSTKSPDEIRQMTDVLRAEITKLKGLNDEYDRKVRMGRENVKHLIPNVVEIQEIANRRAEQLERRKRFERKILSIYNRFPNILTTDQPQIISTDISILNRQLELIQKREAIAKVKIAEYSKKQEHLEQAIVDIRRQNRLQNDLMAQRDKDKVQLSQSLKQELEASKVLYSSDSRQIEKKTETAESQTKEFNVQLDNVKQQFITFSNKRPLISKKAVQNNQTISNKIVMKQKELLNSLDKFTQWWNARRMMRHYADRRDFLEGVLSKAKERCDASYSSIEFIKKGNAARVEELKSLQNMNSHLAKSINEQKTRRIQIEERRQEVEKSFKPLPKDIDHQLKSLRQHKLGLENRAKSLDIELQVLGVNVKGQSPAETRYEDARRHFRSQSQIAAKLKKNIDELKEKIAQQKNGQKSHLVNPLSVLHDSRLLLSEDVPVTVQAASIDILEKLIFNPANDDIDFNTGILVLIHTEKIDLSSFVQGIISAHSTCEYLDQRDEKLRVFIEVWRKWFPNDFQDSGIRTILSPLVNLAGVTGIYDVQPIVKSNATFNVNVPFNQKESKIAFCTSPLILAEHFTFWELQIIKEIQASEYIGCGWTTSEKWTRAPHIMKMTEHFNFISQWIVFQLVTTTIFDERVHLLERWIEIMDAASEIINYQLVFEIYAALCNPAITHLKQTWANISQDAKDTYHKFSNLTTPSARFSAYRAELVKSQPETIVPYIGPFLTSLVYISDGNSSTKTLPNVSEPVINFQKYRSYAMVLRDLMVPWGKDMVFFLCEDLMKRIHTIPPVELSESELYKRSEHLKDS